MRRSILRAMVLPTLVVAACDSPLDPALTDPAEPSAAVVGFEQGKPVPADALFDFVNELQLSWLAAISDLPLHDTYLAVSDDRVSIFATPHGGDVSIPVYEDDWWFGKKVTTGRLNNPRAVAQAVTSQAKASLEQHLRKRGYLD